MALMYGVAECGLLEAWIPATTTSVFPAGTRDEKSKHLLAHTDAVAQCKTQTESTRDSIGQPTEESSRESPSIGQLHRPSKSKRSTLSKSYRVLIFFCVIVNSFLVKAAVSLMMPFFATVALRKAPVDSIGVRTAVGFVFSIATLVEFIAAPLMAKDLPKAGSKLMLLLSALEISGMVLLLGFVNRIEGWLKFLTLSLLIRLVQGICTAANFVSACSITIGMFPDSTGIASGAFRAANGLGYAAGPALSAFLYDNVGYGPPFYIGSGLLFTNTVVLAFVLPSKESHLSPSDMRSDTDYYSILRHVWIWLVLVAVFMANSATGYLEPTYPVYLNTAYGLPISYGGLGLLIWGVVYSSICPFLGYGIDRWLNPRLLQVAGLGLSAIGCQLIGPAPFLPSSKSLGLSYFALVLLAVGLSFNLTAAAPDIFQTLEENNVKNPIAYRAAVAGIFQASMSAGYGAGPILGSTVTASIGFRASTSLLGAVHLGWAIIIACVAFVLWIQRRDECFLSKLVS